MYVDLIHADCSDHGCFVVNLEASRKENGNSYII